MTQETQHADRARRMAQRGQALKGFAVIAGLLALAYGTWHWMANRHHEATDNAYVQAHIVPISAQVPGTVTRVGADDTGIVKSGQELVRLDPADADVALEQAKAQLAQTVREVRTLFVNQDSAQAQAKSRRADVERLRVDVARLQDDIQRREPLVKQGAVGEEELKHLKAQLQAAQAAMSAADAAAQAASEQWQASRALVEGTSVAEHPQVLRAAAKLEEAFLQRQRLSVPTPIDGQVVRRTVQLGQRVAPGTPLMSVVSLDRVWVDANFKESQLAAIRIGQPVELFADVYGKDVVFHGKVEGLGAGTGAAFALLPAQNATGNWIKIVQRVPVRVSLDPKELAAHPLRVGLSMTATVDVNDQSGPLLQAPAQAASAAETAVYAKAQEQAKALAQRIIAANAATR